jgi:hypothetical protein
LTGASACWGSLSRSPSTLRPRPSFTDDIIVEVVDRQLWVKEAESDWVVKYTKRS